MTDEELDTYFVKTLKTILKTYKEYNSYLKEPLMEDDKEMKEDYEYVIDDLSQIIKQVKSIDDLAEMDEDAITAVYNYIDEYANNYIISAYEPQKTKDLEEYSKIEEILSLFLDDDDFEDEEIQIIMYNL